MKHRRTEQVDAVKKSRWPWISRKKALAIFDQLSLLTRLETIMFSAQFAAFETQISKIRMIATELRSENDCLKWRLMELDPEFVHDLEPEYFVVGPNVKQKDQDHPGASR